MAIESEKCQIRNKAKTEFELRKNHKLKKPCLTDFEQTIKAHPKFSQELVESAVNFEKHKLSRIGVEGLNKLGFSDQDIHTLSDDSVILPSETIQFGLLPPWVREFLDQYWVPFMPVYAVHFRNISSFSHDFVVAYETASGLIDVRETRVAAWATGSIHCSPCWDMYRYAWSAWNPDDNVELIRTRTYTIDEINAEESVFKACEDSWDVTITY